MTRKEAIKNLEHYRYCLDFQFGWFGEDDNEAIDMAIESLSDDAIPFDVQLKSTREVIDRFARDRVNVVRCKDCRFWKNEHLCLVMSRYGSIDTKAEHYCSWGERREP